jgi:hypothetical protein
VPTKAIFNQKENSESLDFTEFSEFLSNAQSWNIIIDLFLYQIMPKALKIGFFP